MIGAFTLRKHFYPMAIGQQVISLGAGGPSGVANGPAAGLRPWPYPTGVVRSLVGIGFGTATSTAAVRPQPYGTGSPSPFVPGIQKVQTYTQSYY